LKNNPRGSSGENWNNYRNVEPAKDRIDGQIRASSRGNTNVNV